MVFTTRRVGGFHYRKTRGIGIAALQKRGKLALGFSEVRNLG